MDEMRQLVRILVKIIPHSVTFLASAEEGGGGNRISEERIKYFLDCTLGEAPRPSWGVPQGWGEYLAGARKAPCISSDLHAVPSLGWIDGPSEACMHRKMKLDVESLVCNWRAMWSQADRAVQSTLGVKAEDGCARAELFSWISEQPITRDQAMRCAKREPGRSWEAITSEIRKIGTALAIKDRHTQQCYR